MAAGKLKDFIIDIISAIDTSCVFAKTKLTFLYNTCQTAAAVRVAVGPVDQASRLLLHVHSGRVDPSKTCVIQRFVKLGRRRRNVTNYGGIIASRLNAKSNVIALGATVVGLVLILMRMRMLPLLPRYIIVLLPPTYALQLSVPWSTIVTRKLSMFRFPLSWKEYV